MRRRAASIALAGLVACSNGSNRLAGTVGVEGIPGVTGPTGATGLAGAPGPMGATGPAGMATYVISLADGGSASIDGGVLKMCLREVNSIGDRTTEEATL